jgi:hypothetical protein
VIIGLIPDSALVTINSIELLGIVYLAIAVSKLRSDLAFLTGKLEQREHDEARDEGGAR